MNTIFGTAIFEKDFPFEGPHLVAASAGTGKTYNIQNICARLVAEKGYRVSQIQVMTFTEAATKELRDRIRKVLAIFKNYLTDGVADESEKDRLEKLAACLDDKQTAIDNLNRALMEFDQAAISTIHGFCRRVLARYAFETGNPFDLELGTSSAADIEQRARDWWRKNEANIPEEYRADAEYDTFYTYVRQLAGRSDYELLDNEPPSWKDYLLVEARKVAEEYAGDRLSRAQQTFDDLLIALREALKDATRGPVLAAKLREEYKAALVDEFQDTDPVQYDIFRHVFLDADDGSHPPIFFVGDPKQAIYSFRGGDIYTYQEAATREDVQSRTYHLEKNFRSTSKMIDAVNLIFQDDVKGDTFGSETIDYTEALLSDPKKPALKENGIDDPHPFRMIEVESAKRGVSALVDGVLELLARPEKDVKPKDIAILVTSHDKGGECRNALRAMGVPVVLQHAGNVFSSDVAVEFRTVLQAMSLEGGVMRARAALATRFFDVSYADLVADEDNALVADMLAEFKEIDAIWRKRGFEVAFTKLESLAKCNLRARLTAMAGGERDLADILQIKDLACRAIHEIGPTPEALIAWITDRINASDDRDKEKDAEEYARELESESDAVKIMTMHVSKGLQFPVCFMMLPAKDTVMAGPYPFHDENGKLFFDTDCKSQPSMENYDEKKRLLYVAMTRAKQRTIVITPTKALKTWPTNELMGRAKDRIASGKWAETITWTTYENDEPQHEPYKADSGYKGEFQPLTPSRTDLVSKRPSRGSYTSLSPSGHGGEAGDGRDFDAEDTSRRPEDEEEVHPIFKLKGGAQVGTCWHEILENIPFDAGIDEITELTKKTLRIHGLASEVEEEFQEDVATVAEMISKTLRYRLRAPDGSIFALTEVKASERFSEWEFFFPSKAALPWTKYIKEILEKHWQGDPGKQEFVKSMQGWDRPIPEGFIKGFLDLLFRHGDYYYVVDWKSNQLTHDVSGFTQKGVTAEMAEAGYYFQYLLYAVVLHQFLKETLGTAYSWEKNFGGIKYYFLRGVAAGGEAPVFSDRPSEALLDELAGVLGLKEVR